MSVMSLSSSGLPYRSLRCKTTKRQRIRNISSESWKYEPYRNYIFELKYYERNPPFRSTEKKYKSNWFL